MLRNLYRWLATGQSALASPPLLAAVRSAMRKVRAQQYSCCILPPYPVAASDAI